MTKNRVCCVFNFAPHYRTAIYSLMDKELGCDFYFGDKVATPIKKLNYLELEGFIKEVENLSILNTFFIWQKGVIKLIFKKKYKHFILTGDSSIFSNWVIAFFAILLNKKVYLWMHGLKKELSWKGKLLTYPFYHLADKFLLYSDYSKELMLKAGFSPEKILCIYNSLDYDLQFSIRQKLSKSNIYLDYFKNNYPVLIYIGRIQKSKKIDLILDSMVFLKNKGIHTNLVIVGSDNEDTGLEENIVNGKLANNVWLYGSCYDEIKIGELIYNANVCVSPGNIGLTAIHTLSYGTPAITHNNISEQMPEFEAIHLGVTGDFFEENNSIDLGNTIEKWINLNASLREKVRLAAYKLIDERYNPYFQINVLKKIIY